MNCLLLPIPGHITTHLIVLSIYHVEVSYQPINNFRHIQGFIDECNLSTTLLARAKLSIKGQILINLSKRTLNYI